MPDSIPYADADLVAIFRATKTIAVVGLSPKPWRESYKVAAYLQQQGYRIIPVRPGAKEILGEPAYPSLTDVPVPIDLVDIFRQVAFIPPVVVEAIAVGAKVVWMQDELVHEEAAAQARAAGLTVIMDTCTNR